MATQQKPEDKITNFFETVRKTGQAWTYSQGPGQFHVYPRGANNDMAACPLWSTKAKASEHADQHGECNLVALSVDFLANKMLVDFEKLNVMIGIDWDPSGDGFDAPAPGVKSILTSDQPYVSVKKVD